MKRFNWLAVLVLGLAPVLLPSPASAAVVSKTDPQGDAIPRLDIVRVTYTNAPGPARVRIRVPELQRLGTARFTVAPPDSDVAYVASVNIDGSGRMHKRFSWQTDVSNVAKPCAFGVEWRAVDGYIKVSVPRECLKNLDNSRPLYLAARMGNGPNTDFAPAAHSVARG